MAMFIKYKLIQYSCQLLRWDLGGDDEQVGDELCIETHVFILAKYLVNLNCAVQIDQRIVSVPWRMESDVVCCALCFMQMHCLF